METLKSIKTRRSIRGFSNRPVSQEKIKRIIDSGLRAPCSKGIAPWYILVLRGKKKDLVAKFMKETINENLDGPMDPLKLKPAERVDKKIRVSTLASAGIVESSNVLILVFNSSPFSRNNLTLIRAMKKAKLSLCKRMLVTREVETQGVAACVENMLLAATNFGLGSVWLADVVASSKKIKKYFNVKYDLMTGIALGYPKYHLKEKKVDWSKVKFL